MNTSILKELFSVCSNPSMLLLKEVILIIAAALLSFLIFYFLKKFNLIADSKHPFAKQLFSKGNLFILSSMGVLFIFYLSFFALFKQRSSLTLLCLTALPSILVIRTSKRLFSKPVHILVALAVGAAALLVLTGYYVPLIKFLNQFDLKIGVIKTSLLKLIQSIALISILTWIAVSLSNKFEVRINDNKQFNKSTKLLLSKIFRVTVITLSVFIGMSLVGIDLSIITFFAGAIGVAVGFGLQNILSNVFCGIIILFDKSIRPGDVVTLEDIKTYGIVHKLNARFISIRTREGIEHLIPNEVFISKKTENWTHSDSFIRVSISFFVSLNSDIDLVEKVLLEIASRAERVVKNRVPHVRVYSLNSYSIEMRLRVWIEDPENGFSSLKSFIYKEAIKAFKDHHIEMPHPPMNIFLNKNANINEPEIAGIS